MSDLEATQGTAPSESKLEAFARAHEIEAISLLVETIRDPAIKIEHRIKAAERIMDQARGRPKTADPAKLPRKNRKAVELTEDQLLKIIEAAQRGGSPAKSARPPKSGEVLEGEIVPATTQRQLPARRAPRNEYQDDVSVEDLLT